MSLSCFSGCRANLFESETAAVWVIGDHAAAVLRMQTMIARKSQTSVDVDATGVSQ